MKISDVFKEEWKLFRKHGDGELFMGERPKGDAEFDGDIRVGQVRIFADMSRPFVAVVIEDCGLSGWRIVPVSPFTVPASVREMVVGRRVLQLWNACIAARAFVERSWLVDELAASEVADIRAGVLQASPGRITRGKGIVARYERMFLVPGGSFLQYRKPQWRVRLLAFRPYIVSAAALLVVCLGSFLIMQRNDEVAFNEHAIVDYHHGVCEKKAVFDSIEVCCAAPLAEPSIAYSAAPRKAMKMAPAKVLAKAKTIMGSRADWRSEYVNDASTERYAEYAENEFLSPKSNPLSTFSLDVDTSSYTLMRRFIVEDKTLPPANSVRAEEYINYFKYNYPEPVGDDPIAANCELAKCPWNPKHQLLRIGLQAKRIDNGKLPPSNLTFLIDTSGSMKWNNGMNMVKSSLRLLVDNLRDIDHVSIVTYANGTAVRLPSTPGSRKGEILAAIDSLFASGGTAGAAGIQLAYDEAKRNFSRDANNRVILVTDGDFNIGLSSPKELEDFVAEKRSSGIFLSVFGVGSGNYQDGAMKKLANAGNGNYAYIDSLLEAKKVMITEFGGTLFTVAKDVKIQLEFNPARVSGYRLIGYENRMLEAKDFNDDKKDAGEIGSGHSMTALYEIIPVGVDNTIPATDALKYQQNVSVDSDELFTLKMRWKKPDGDVSMKREVAHSAKAIMREAPSEDFTFASAVAEYALILSKSKYKGDSSFDSVMKRARSSKGKDDEGYRAEFIRLVEQAMLMK